MLTLGSRLVTSPNSSTSGLPRFFRSSSIGFIYEATAPARRLHEPSPRGPFRRHSAIFPAQAPPGRRSRSAPRLPPLERRVARVDGPGAQLEADPEELVVFRHAVGPGEASGLDLARVRTDREV